MDHSQNDYQGEARYLQSRLDDAIREAEHYERLYRKYQKLYERLKDEHAR